MEFDPPVTTVIIGYSTLSRVSMGSLTLHVTDAQGFLYDMLLPAMNVSGLGHHLLSGGIAALKGVITVIDKESYFDVGYIKMCLRKDTDYPTIDCFDLDLAPRGNCQTEAAFTPRVISGHTIPMGSALASQRLRIGAVGAVSPRTTVKRPFIVTSTAVPGLLALRSTASDHAARLINGGIIEAASAFTATTPFAAPATTPGLPTTTATATPAIPVTAMAAAGYEHVVPVPDTSKQAHHAGRAEYRRVGSHFPLLANRVRLLQDQQGHHAVVFQKVYQDRDHGTASACSYRLLGVP